MNHCWCFVALWSWWQMILLVARLCDSWGCIEELLFFSNDVWDSLFIVLRHWWVVPRILPWQMRLKQISLCWRQVNLITSVFLSPSGAICITVAILLHILTLLKHSWLAWLHSQKTFWSTLFSELLLTNSPTYFTIIEIKCEVNTLKDSLWRSECLSHVCAILILSTGSLTILIGWSSFEAFYTWTLADHVL